MDDGLACPVGTILLPRAGKVNRPGEALVADRQKSFTMPGNTEPCGSSLQLPLPWRYACAESRTLPVHARAGPAIQQRRAGRRQEPRRQEGGEEGREEGAQLGRSGLRLAQGNQAERRSAEKDRRAEEGIRPEVRGAEEKARRHRNARAQEVCRRGRQEVQGRRQEQAGNSGSS